MLPETLPPLLKAVPLRADFPRPGEDVAQRQKGECGCDQREQTEGVLLRTLPKSAGNISLTLREWGLFCIESRLQGAGGV